MQYPFGLYRIIIIIIVYSNHSTEVLLQLPALPDFSEWEIHVNAVIVPILCFQELSVQDEQ